MAGTTPFRTSPPDWSQEPRSRRKDRARGSTSTTSPRSSSSAAIPTRSARTTTDCLLMRDLLPLCQTVRIVGVPSVSRPSHRHPRRCARRGAAGQAVADRRTRPRRFHQHADVLQRRRPSSSGCDVNATVGMDAAGPPRRARRSRTSTGCSASARARHRLIAALPAQELRSRSCGCSPPPATTPTS